MNRILIVDEDQPFQNMLKEVLVQPERKIDAISQGKTALEIVRTQNIDLIITETHLPDMQAEELIQGIHLFDPTIPVIVLTSDDSWETSKRIRIDVAPVFYYGFKPVDFREIQQVVYYVLRWRQIRNAKAL